MAKYTYNLVKKNPRQSFECRFLKTFVSNINIIDQKKSQEVHGDGGMDYRKAAISRQRLESIPYNQNGIGKRE